MTVEIEVTPTGFTARCECSAYTEYFDLVTAARLAELAPQSLSRKNRHSYPPRGLSIGRALFFTEATLDALGHAIQVTNEKERRNNA